MSTRALNRISQEDAVDPERIMRSCKAADYTPPGLVEEHHGAGSDETDRATAALNVRNTITSLAQHH